MKLLKVIVIQTDDGAFKFKIVQKKIMSSKALCQQ